MSSGTHRGKIIHLATDHAGFEMKEGIKSWLTLEGWEVTDHGSYKYEENDDFPDFIHKAADAVSQDLSAVGIILGGSGQGEAMAANRHLGVRATVYYGGDTKIITLSRSHNDANMLSLGARFLESRRQKQLPLGRHHYG